MLFPSASLVRGYEPVTVALTDGRVLTGIVKAEDREKVTLALEAERQQRVLRTDIEEILPSPVSLMPQGLDKILTAQDFADLIAFLKQ
jgi:putative heme-binding domain-containing protein